MAQLGDAQPHGSPLPAIVAAIVVAAVAIYIIYRTNESDSSDGYVCDAQTGSCRADPKATQTKAQCEAACVAQPTYACDHQTGQCTKGPGAWTDLQQCSAACQPAQYKCDSTTGQCKESTDADAQPYDACAASCTLAASFACDATAGCIAAKDGSFPSIDACEQSGCSKSATKYKCDLVAGCIAAEDGTFSSMKECVQSNCAPASSKYKCDPVAGCIAAKDGTFSSLKECVQSKCAPAPSKYKCDAAAGICTPSSQGSYDSLPDCKDACSPPPPGNVQCMCYGGETISPCPFGGEQCASCPAPMTLATPSGGQQQGQYCYQATDDPSPNTHAQYFTTEVCDLPPGGIAQSPTSEVVAIYYDRASSWDCQDNSADAFLQQFNVGPDVSHFLLAFWLGPNNVYDALKAWSTLLSDKKCSSSGGGGTGGACKNGNATANTGTTSPCVQGKPCCGAPCMDQTSGVTDSDCAKCMTDPTGWACSNAAVNCGLCQSEVPKDTDAPTSGGDDSPATCCSYDSVRALTGKTAIMASAFGATGTPIAQNLDPTDAAQALAQFVVDNKLDGADVDHEEAKYYLQPPAKDMTYVSRAAEWITEFTRALRDAFNSAEAAGNPPPCSKLGGPQHYQITHAPQAPQFGQRCNYTYRDIDQRVGDLIDFYNVQFYNQNISSYDTYKSLAETSGFGMWKGPKYDVFPCTAIYQLASPTLYFKEGIPLKRIVVGKPVLTTDLGNTGYVEQDALADLITQVQKNNPVRGVMGWQHHPGTGTTQKWASAMRAALSSR